MVIKELDASQTARALDSVDAAVINNNYAVTAGLKKSDAIFTEPVNKDSQQWINIIVANKFHNILSLNKSLYMPLP